MILAFTRAVSPRLPECELTHLDRAPIDVVRAEAQHAAYESALAGLGLEVRRVAPAPEHPDGVFVEDTAVVLDDVALIARPGARSRRGEVESVAAALAGLRPLLRVPAPMTLDGGDVLVAGRTLYVGASDRTGGGVHAWLRSELGPRGYDVREVPVRGCLHLKTAVTMPVPGTFLLNPDWAPVEAFDGRIVEVDPSEPHAANVLAVDGRVIVAEGAPRTRRRLKGLGLDVVPVDVSELVRAEAGVTCCSLLVPLPGSGFRPGGGDAIFDAGNSGTEG